MHKRSIAAMTAAIAGLALAVPLSSLPAAASSHREAPTIATDPTADNTDVYAFTSPEAQDTVTLIANSYPFQLPAGGPNFYPFSDDVKYEIHVDNVGDGADHIVFSYTFNKKIVNTSTFLYNTGLMKFNGSGYSNWNETETYNLDMTVNGVTTRIGSNVLTPPNNVGPHSVGSPAAYDALAKAAITKLPNGVKTFAGQRADGFFVDLGATFDLLGVNPAGGVNVLNGLNVNQLAVQVPKSLLEGPNGDHVIGVWATNSRQTMQNVNADGSRSAAGAFQQVSRLGNPLVNEAVIQLKYKDVFNARPPATDGSLPGEVLDRVSDPELAKLFRALHLDDNAPQGAGFGTGGNERKDLETVFLTGIPGINQPTNRGTAKPAEMLRLNMSTAVTTTNPNAVNRMGVLGGQLDGFPNGRRPADDVVDIELQAVDGVLCQDGGPLKPASGSCRTGKVNPAFGDGVNAAQVAFQTCFPYLANPIGPNGSGAPVSSCPGATFPATSAVRSTNNPILALGIVAVLALAAVAGLGIYRRKANA
ncbi:MAG: DUF4331 domain-containing protein [Candidatus Dormibacteria bacterium]